MEAIYAACRGRALLFARLAVLVVLLVVWGSLPAPGQDIERYKPKVPPSQEGEAKLPEEPAPAEGDNRVLVDELRGLVFVDSQEKVVLGPMDVTGLKIDSRRGLQILHSNAFERIASKYLGEPVSIYRLNQLARDVILFYRRNDLPVVDVSIPEQDVTDGVVQIVVTEGRVGRVRVEGARYFNPNVLLRRTSIRPGNRIYESWLLEDLRWLNRNPFREVDLELTPGANFGETDIVFRVDDRPPVQVYTGYEDSGTRDTNLERIFFGANWGNALWQDHQLSYQYTTSRDFESLRAHSGVYAIPVGRRDELVFYGGYGDVEGSVPAPFDDLSGKAWQSSFRYNKHLRPRLYGRTARYDHRLVGGFEFKQTNTDLDFGGISVYDTPADVAQMVFGYHGLKQGPRGTCAVGADLFISPGGFSPYNNDVAFQQFRAFADDSYVYGRAYLEVYRDFVNNLNFMGRITGQLADSNLLPTEQLGFGGYNSVRGYDMRLVNGDSGYIINLELRTDPVSFGLGRKRSDQFQVLTFCDIGGAMNHTLLPGEDSHVDLSSVGFGMRYAIAPNLAVRFDYGWQLHHYYGDPVTSRPHLAIIVAR